MQLFWNYYLHNNNNNKKKKKKKSYFYYLKRKLLDQSHYVVFREVLASWKKTVETTKLNYKQTENTNYELQI